MAETGADRPPLPLPETAQPSAYSAAMTGALPIVTSTREDKTMTDITEAQTTETDTNAADKIAVFDVLAEIGIHTVTVAFDGYGDSGQIEGIEAFDAESNPVPLPDNRPVRLSAEETNLREAIETLSYACLEETQAAWENDEGAYGTFVFGVPDRSITLDHNARFTDVVTSHHRF
jgi:hypothetical protein